MKSTPNTLPSSRTNAMPGLFRARKAPHSRAGGNGGEYRSDAGHRWAESAVLSGATQTAGLALHELLGMAELTRIAYEKGELASAQERLSLLVAEAAGLASDIDNILELSRLESGAAQPERVHFDIVAVLHEVSQSARLLAGGKPVTVMDVAAAGPVVLYSDPVRLKRIMGELMGNAVRFTDRGRIALILCRDEDSIRLTVADTGRGMTRERIKAFFEDFDDGFGGEATVTGHHGLGLRIVKKTVKLLGGALSVSSRVNEGTIVEVSLPLTGENGT